MLYANNLFTFFERRHPVQGVFPHMPSIRDRRDERDERLEASAGDRLRDRYEDLKQLRITQPEREAAAARQALEKHTSASDALVASLRKQLEDARTQQPVAGSENESDAALRAENAELRRQLEAAKAASAPASAAVQGNAALEAKVTFYEMMTGMNVEFAAGDVAKCVVHCAASDDEDAPAAGAPPRRATFELHLSPEGGDEGDVEYVPTDLSALPAESLPEYLRETVRP